MNIDHITRITHIAFTLTGNGCFSILLYRYNLGVFFLGDNFYQRAKFQFHEALRIFTGFLGEENHHTKTTVAAIDKLRDLMG